MANRIDDGGPAFPERFTNSSDGNTFAPDGRLVPPHETIDIPGMSLRDYFAANAMQGMLSCHPTHYVSPATTGEEDSEDTREYYQLLAVIAYVAADGMIAARKRVKP